MNIHDYIKCIPDLLNLFVPGYIFLSILGYMIKEDNKNFDITAISSIIISYIIQVFIGILGIQDTYTEIIAIMIAVISALIAVKIRMSEVYKHILVKLGKITGKNSIWEEFFDKNKGTKVRFYTTIDNTNVTIIGNIRYYEINNDNECTFIISNYEIQYPDGRFLNSSNDNYTMIFNTKNINGLEAHYGKKVS